MKRAFKISIFVFSLLILIGCAPKETNVILKSAEMGAVSILIPANCSEYVQNNLDTLGLKYDEHYVYLDLWKVFKADNRYEKVLILMTNKHQSLDAALSVRGRLSSSCFANSTITFKRSRITEWEQLGFTIEELEEKGLSIESLHVNKEEIIIYLANEGNLI